ncbi:MAG: hypothetical protein HY716_01325 [Planctomycetes bacterium]|nr:hypothetical protein [Planctomycetota bacterium]
MGAKQLQGLFIVEDGVIRRQPDLEINLATWSQWPTEEDGLDRTVVSQIYEMRVGTAQEETALYCIRVNGYDPRDFDGIGNGGSHAADSVEMPVVSY